MFNNNIKEQYLHMTFSIHDGYCQQIYLIKSYRYKPIICRGETHRQKMLLKTNQLQECVTKVRNISRLLLKRIQSLQMQSS